MNTVLWERFAERFSSQIAKHGSRNVQELADDALEVLRENRLLRGGAEMRTTCYVCGGELYRFEQGDDTHWDIATCLNHLSVEVSRLEKLSARDARRAKRIEQENEVLRDAIDHLWSALYVEQVEALSEENPRLVELAQRVCSVSHKLWLDSVGRGK